MLSKIDTNYILSEKRISHKDETPLCTKSEESKGEESAFDSHDAAMAPQDFGTVTEFYFLL